VIRTPDRPARWTALALAVLIAMALTAAGCGDDETKASDHPAEDPELVDQAMQKIDRAAARYTNPVRDRYIPGPKSFKIVCLDPEQARAKNVTDEFIQCHVEAFSTPTKGKPETVYVESEDWRVPVEPNGTVGEPVIVDGYRIRDYLRKDHKLGCSVGKTPAERCKTPFPAGG
jgi:hypothetical protein